MKTLVCFSVVPDLDLMQEEDFKQISGNQIDTSFVKNMLNCFDESALEFGLKLSDESKEKEINFEKEALSIGNIQTEIYLKTLLALKYDKVIKIDKKNNDLRFKPGIIASNIAKYGKRNNIDLYIIGRQSAVGNNFITPQLLSKQLDILYIANAVDIHIYDKSSVLLTIEKGECLIEQKVKLPAVVSLGNAVISKLRMPTLKNRMQSKHKTITEEKISIDDKNIFGKIEKLMNVNRNRDSIKVSPEDGVKKLIEIYENRRK